MLRRVSSAANGPPTTRATSPPPEPRFPLPYTNVAWHRKRDHDHRPAPPHSRLHSHAHQQSQLRRYASVDSDLSTTADGDYIQKGRADRLAGGPRRQAFPSVSFGGVNAPNAWGGAPFDEAQTNYVLQDNLQWVRGKHVLGFGVQLQFTQNNDARPSQGSSASFSFSNTETAGYSPTGTLRRPRKCLCQLHAGSGLFGDHHQQQRSLVGPSISRLLAFVQDDWKLTPRSA